MSGDKGSTTQSKIELSPEAREALTQEIGMFVDRIIPEQSALQSQLLQTLSPASSGPLSGNVLQSLGMADAATRHAGGQGGRVSADDINSTVQGLEELQPAAMDQLKGLSRKVAGDANTVIDPRFAFALRPDQLTKTSPGSGQQAMQAAQLAVSIAGVVALAAT